MDNKLKEISELHPLDYENFITDIRLVHNAYSYSGNFDVNKNHSKVAKQMTNDIWLTVAKVHLNCFGNAGGAADEEPGFIALFDDISAANHTCNPNCQVYIDHDTKVGKMTAMEAIPKGEEIMIDYSPNLKNSHDKHVALHSHYGFWCACDPRLYSEVCLCVAGCFIFFCVSRLACHVIASCLLLCLRAVLVTTTHPFQLAIMPGESSNKRRVDVDFVRGELEFRASKKQLLVCAVSSCFY